LRSTHRHHKQWSCSRNHDSHNVCCIVSSDRVWHGTYTTTHQSRVRTSAALSRVHAAHEACTFTRYEYRQYRLILNMRTQPQQQALYLVHARCSTVTQLGLWLQVQPKHVSITAVASDNQPHHPLLTAVSSSGSGLNNRLALNPCCCPALVGRPLRVLPLAVLPLVLLPLTVPAARGCTSTRCPSVCTA
jgi:hypothetical protein